MPKIADVFVTTVFVVDQYSNNADRGVEELAKILKSKYANYEIVLIDNGLSVHALKPISELLKTTPCIRVVRLAKNYDTDTAVFAGIEASIGDYICILYNHDPVVLVPSFVDKAMDDNDVVFGIATNLRRRSKLEEIGAKLFYWYSRRYMHIDVLNKSTYFLCMNRSVANALTRSGRYMRHIRHMAQRVGFTSTTLNYKLPSDNRQYSYTKLKDLVLKAIDLASSYSSHPLRAISYFGIIAGLLNVVYAIYVVIINLSSRDVAKGWTTLSLQSSSMFFVLFLILALLAEYIGKILNETQQEPPYHIMQELSSTISIADETRLNVAK